MKSKKISHKRSILGKLALEFIAVLGFLLLMSVSGNPNKISQQTSMAASNGTSELTSMAMGFLSDHWDRQTQP